MKKIITLIFLGLSLLIISCKETIKKPAPIEKYTIEPKTTTINWTAYKTTAKLPVNGVFKTIKIPNIKSGATQKDALNGLTFSIPINSIDTKNEGRDAKIVKDFFGTMKSTSHLTGKISLSENGKGTINLTMNGITKDLPMTYIISGQLINLNATLNLDNWQAKLAIDALNAVCKDKHKGEDGISKTWSEVQLNIVTYLKGK